MTPLRTALEQTVWKRVVSFDQALLLLVRRLESAAMTRVMKGVTHLGDTASWVVIGLALGAAGGKNGMRYAALVGAAAALAVGSSQLLKRLCCRPRPAHGLRGFAALVECPDALSFPSGHSAVAFAIAVALAGQGAGLGLLTLVLATGIALSRVYLGAHYPVDVAAGVLVGALAGLAARLLVDWAHFFALLGSTVLALLGLTP
jgi:undecaprenyl-diphosphatase